MQYQQQSTVQVSTQQPAMQTMVAVQQPPVVRVGFAHNTAKGFGLFQIICGTLVIIFGIVAIAIENMLAEGGTPIWTGILFIITGVIGVVSSHQKTNGIIVASMVMSIISACISGTILLIVSSVACGIEWERYYYGYSYYDHDCDDHNGGCKYSLRTRQTIDGMLILLALLETIVAIVNSSFCCRTVCCGPKSLQPVMYYVAAPQGNVPQQVAMAPGMIQPSPMVYMLPQGVQMVSPVQGPQMYPAQQYQPQPVGMPQQQQFAPYGATAPPVYTSNPNMQSSGGANIAVHNAGQEETKTSLAEPQA